jgi:hypothetical protein
MWGATSVSGIPIRDLLVGFEIALNRDVGVPCAIAQISRAFYF